MKRLYIHNCSDCPLFCLGQDEHDSYCQYPHEDIVEIYDFPFSNDYKSLPLKCGLLKDPIEINLIK